MSREIVAATVMHPAARVLSVYGGWLCYEDIMKRLYRLLASTGAAAAAPVSTLRAQATAADNTENADANAEQKKAHTDGSVRLILLRLHDIRYAGQISPADARPRDRV